MLTFVESPFNISLEQVDKDGEQAQTYKHHNGTLFEVLHFWE